MNYYNLTDESLIKMYHQHNDIVKFYSGKRNLDIVEVKQEAFSRGYCEAFKVIYGTDKLNNIKDND